MLPATRPGIGSASLFIALAMLLSGDRAPAATSTEPGAATQSATEARPDLPRVYLFATGGTISNRDGGRLTVDELIASVPDLGRYVRAEGEQFSNTSSGALTLDQWLNLSKQINRRLRDDPGLAGIVVTVGTDTLEELAYFLHLTVRDERPVAVVGAMRNPSTLGYEGAANLEDGFRVAGAPASRGLGTVVVLNDEINSAREVTKTDALRLDTFTSRAYGLLGVADRDRVVYYRKPVKRHSAASEFDVETIDSLPRVDIILTYQGASGDLITAAADAGAKGIVVAGAGAGATSGTQGEAIRDALARHVFVISTTRTGSGRVAGGRGGRGGADAYRLAGDDLQPLKARILLMLALSVSAEPDQVRRMLAEY